MGCAGTASHKMSLAKQDVSGSQGCMRVWVLLPEIPVKSTFKVGHQNSANAPLLRTKHMYVAGAEGAKLPCPGFQSGHLWYVNWMPEQCNMRLLTQPTFLLMYCATVSIYGCIYISVLVQISWTFPLEVALPIASLYCALVTPWSDLGAHKPDCFQMKVNWKLCSSSSPVQDTPAAKGHLVLGSD